MKRLNEHQIRALERALETAREIRTLDRAKHLTDSGDAYAYSLGRAKGLAFDIIVQLENILEVKK